MQASRTMGALPGVDTASVSMGTPLNLDLLPGMGFEPVSARPDDLVVAIAAGDDAALAAARDALDAALTATARPRAAEPADPPRTADAAVRRSGANLALISVPGPHAFVEAMSALAAGAHVMIFSDNVPLDQEVTLKAEAARRGLLCMGPDCGTAIIAGAGLGFANVTRPGPVGIVGAAGTGIQQVVCLLDDAGVGISHALGSGGRDLSQTVAAAATLPMIALLDADPDTRVIVIVAKQPAPEVAATVRTAAAACATPTALAFLGPGATSPVEAALEDAAGQALQALGIPAHEARHWPARRPQSSRPGSLRGLFAGGSHCQEAAAIVAERLGPVSSNATGTKNSDAIRPQNPHPPGHALIDFGDDAFTQGRAHPMIDQRLRLEWLQAAALGADDGQNAAVSILLLDVVLGHGAHADPAAELAPAIAAASEQGLNVVVSLCGTRDDPQGLERQAETLRDANASVWLCNGAAARHAASLVGAGATGP